MDFIKKFTLLIEEEIWLKAKAKESREEEEEEDEEEGEAEKSSSYDCMSSQALSAYFNSKVSTGKSSLNGIDRLWKNYQGRMTIIYESLFTMFTEISAARVLSSLKPDLSDQVFSLSVLQPVKESWFGVRYICVFNWYFQKCSQKFPRVDTKNAVRFSYENGKSCFTSFVNPGIEQLTEVLEFFEMGQRTALQGIDWLEPWKSAASFKDMSASLSAYATKHFIRSKESQFRNKMDSLNQHLREHEIHLLFGALRSKMASSFVVSPTCKFIQFVHYFRQSSIFALSLKATVLRCLVKDPDVFSTPAKLKSALQENVSHEMFSDHLQLHFDEVNVHDTVSQLHYHLFHTFNRLSVKT